MMTTERIPASFRDPSGFLFVRDGAVHRQINESYRHDYDLLVGSGLYQHLVRTGLLLAHEETPHVRPSANGAYKVIRPEQLGLRLLSIRVVFQPAQGLGSDDAPCPENCARLRYDAERCERLQRSAPPRSVRIHRHSIVQGVPGG